MSHIAKPIDQVLIEDTKVFHHLLLGGPGGVVVPQNTVPCADFAHHLAEQYVAQGKLSFGLVPEGMNIRDIHQNRGLYVFLVQIDPSVRTLRWLTDDSPEPFGLKAQYREVTIALPYVYFFVAIAADGVLSVLNSVYFRNTPLTSLEDQLLECAFFNCSVDSYKVHCWICTQGLTMKLQKGQSLAQLVDTFVGWFWGSGFNASSEHHEGQSFWSKTTKDIQDSRLHTIKDWAKATRKNPRFACEVPWLAARRTPNQIYAELTAGGTEWDPKNSALFASLVTQIAARVRKDGNHVE
jgi:hypothetical protein